MDIRSTLTELCEAFNAHDLDRIMAFFADDCVLEMPRGSQPWGSRFEGKPNVRDALATRFEGLPDVHYEGYALRRSDRRDRHLEMDTHRHHPRRRDNRGPGLRFLHVPGRQGDRQGLILEDRGVAVEESA
jgi:hypothetical protein